MGHRLEKISSLIKEELSLIFLKLQDPRLSMLTVTGIKVSPDLKHTKVYISVFDKEKREPVLERINELKAMIRSQLAGKIQLRFVPELHFFIDDTTDYVEKMEGLFKKIHEDDNQKDNS